MDTASLSIGVIHNVLYTIFMQPPTTCTFKPFSACSNVITVLAEASTAFFSVYAFIKTRCFSLWFCGERCRLRTPRSGCFLLSRSHSCLFSAAFLAFLVAFSCAFSVFSASLFAFLAAFLALTSAFRFCSSSRSFFFFSRSIFLFSFSSFSCCFFILLPTVPDNLC